jgi:hypothetical protein
MKYQCHSCQKTFSGSGLTIELDGKQDIYCVDCFWATKKDLTKETCEDCIHFTDESCQVTGEKLVATSVGMSPYFLQRMKCQHFLVNSESNIIEVKIKNLEAQGCFEQAAQEYEKLGMTEKAEATRKKASETSVPQADADALVKQLAKKGQTLTYYCCHCGAPLKIGAKKELLQNCLKCGGDLTIINLAKLISQHTQK